MPLPNPDDDLGFPADIAESLSDVGEMMTRGEAIRQEKLELLVKSAYGLG